MNESNSNNIETKKNYIITSYIKSLTDRALIYINSGFPIHLRGSAGVGKTSLAFHIANKIGNTILFICGSEEINDENLIGGYVGIKKYYIEDNFVSSVYKQKEISDKLWKDGRLLTACKEGYTVIYDEFTRTPSNINNVLLSILEERIIDIPYINYKEYLKINPNFKMIFTSNPDEYIGVYKSPDALLDRMITIDMDSVDEETERSIIISQTGISAAIANKITNLSRLIRKNISNKAYASIRSSIMLAQVIQSGKIKMSPTNLNFKNVCRDIYNSSNISMGLTEEQKNDLNTVIDNAINIILTEN